MKRLVFLFAILCSSACFAVQAGSPNRIVGVWKSATQDYIVKIDKIGNSFQGRIIWVKSVDGSSPALDKNNPDQRLRNMPLRGNKIIQEVSFNPTSSKWEGGTYYDFTEGKQYPCEIAVIGENTLKIIGKAGSASAVEQTLLRQ